MPTAAYTSRIRTGNLHRLVAAGGRRADRHDALEPRLARPRNHLTSVGPKRLFVKMRVSIDEQHAVSVTGSTRLNDGK